MITIVHSVVLGTVLCVSSAGTLGQDKDYEALVKVITIGEPDSAAIAMHRLTVTNVRQMFAVDRELLELKKTVPDLETRVSELRRQFDPQGRAGSADVELAARNPAILVSWYEKPSRRAAGARPCSATH